MRIIGICGRGPGQSLKVIASLRLLSALALAALAVTGCGDEDGGSPPTRTATAVSRLTVQVSELETAIAEYCEERNSGSASAVEEDKAAGDVQELIGLARRYPDEKLGSEATPTARDALGDVLTVLRADCRNPALEQRVDRALDALP